MHRTRPDDGAAKGLSMSETLQILGAVVILAAFIAVQYGAIDPRSYLSLALNLAGSGLLAWLAFSDRQWGFVLLEASWAAVSALGLRNRVSRRPKV
jgi:hypothetical protein